ncbi:MAG: thioredoxin family protein [Acholeplasmatales bacterium]|nr:thioredoxin family protein [Acholeplasmatales bacterium]
MWLNKDNYKEYLKGISIVEVSGESCANCLTLMPILDRLVSDRTDCKLYHIEASDDTMELVNMFNVYSVPTILVMYDLEVKASVRGFQPEEILEIWLDSKIDDIKKEYNIN